jgi:hypothetical protein
MNNEGKTQISALKALVAEVTLELLRAVDFHPIDNRTPPEWLAVIGKEYGKAQKAAYGDGTFEPDKGVTWRDHRTELVQTAATVLRAILALDTYTINAPQQPAVNTAPRKYRLFPDCVVCNNGEATKPCTLDELETLCDRHRHTLKEWLDEHSAALPPKRRIVADYESPECIVCTGKATRPRTVAELEVLCQEHYSNYVRHGSSV